MNEYLNEWQPDPRAMRLQEMAEQYHTECEAYDRTVCTGPVTKDGIMPATHDECALINRNALTVLQRILAAAEREGFSWRELADAIVKCT